MPDPDVMAQVSVAKRFLRMQGEIEQSRLRQLIAFTAGLCLGLYGHAAITVVGRLMQ